MTQYQRCRDWVKRHLGKMKKADFALFWGGWTAALGWHGNCKDCKFLENYKCIASPYEPCHRFEPKTLDGVSNQ